jgi:hypothetical protein
LADEPLFPVLAAMLECARVSLSKPATRVTMLPGSSVVEDDCCENGGQLYLRVISIVGASGLRVPASQPCVPLYQIRCAIGTSRCVHTVDDQGKPPTPAEMTADVKQSLQDRADIMKAFSCCIGPLVDERMDMGGLVIEDWTPSPAMGGCLTTEVVFHFQQVLCLPCDEEVVP